jgi:hypothetical protein
LNTSHDEELEKFIKSFPVRIDDSVRAVQYLPAETPRGALELRDGR